MKKCLLWLLPVLLLWGCGPQEVFEQIGDVYEVIGIPPQAVAVDLPGDAVVHTLGSGQDNAIYFCDGYTLTVQTLAGGDLNRSIGELTGFPLENMTLYQTGNGAVRRYVGTWTCLGETGEQVGRLVLLDDGNYHYAVTVMAPAESVSALQLTWDTVLGSVSLADIETWTPGTVPGTAE